jgi:Mlc titration factor MtfA (ptsG expression regulator)
MFRWLTERRRRNILDRPFPPAWVGHLERNVAAYRQLDDAERRRLRELVQVFVAEKSWEGCGGLEMRDEIKVTVAGQACLLLLGRDHDLFAEVDSILVYPSPVRRPAERRYVADSSVRVEPPRPFLLGSAGRGGPVILSWDSVLGGARDPADGRNVVLHEFAHKIDYLDGQANGAPPLADPARARSWYEAFSGGFAALQRRVERGEPGFLRDYGATNPAEFFAVATEAFFEQPVELRREEPELYDALADFYNLDLAGRRLTPA